MNRSTRLKKSGINTSFGENTVPLSTLISVLTSTLLKRIFQPITAAWKTDWSTLQNIWDCQMGFLDT